VFKPSYYHYEAFVTSVYDADTITAEISFGQNIYRKKNKLRLFGINAPEVRGPQRPQGLLARDYLRALILNKTIAVETILDKKGKYGRLLAILYLETYPDHFININEQLVSDGYANFKTY
jgi:micrococcal nuclease